MRVLWVCLVLALSGLRSLAGEAENSRLEDEVLLPPPHISTTEDRAIPDLEDRPIPDLDLSWQSEDLGEKYKRKQREEARRNKYWERTKKRWETVLSDLNSLAQSETFNASALLIKSEEETFSENKPRTEETIYGSKILARAKVPKDVQKTISDALSDWKSFTNLGAQCFLPGLQLEYHDGKDVAVVLVCLDCRWVKIRCRGRAEMIALNADGVAAFGAIFKSLFPETSPTIDDLIARKRQTKPKWND